MTPDTKTKPTLVLGGTGKTGRRVAERLMARDIPVRLGSRSASRPSTGRTRRPGRPRCDGRRARCTSPTTRTSRSRARAEAIARLRASWRCAAGVRRLVLLSGRGEPNGRARRAGRARLPAPTWTDRALDAGSCQNFSEDFTCSSTCCSGEVVLPAGERADAVRRRRRHRRRRRRGADRRPAHRRALRADRPAAR